MTEIAEDLCRFIDASPSPYHVVASVARRLEAAGFHAVDESSPWPSEPGGWYVTRGGSIVAWRTSASDTGPTPFRLVGAHTDSPNLRLKPNAATGAAGVRQLAVEVYGGVLLNSWLGRDLGISGRVVLRSDPPGSVRLVRDDRPLAHLPQLAIHLDRDVNEHGLVLNRQAHLSPIIGLGTPSFDAIAAGLGFDAADVLAHDLMLHDLVPSAVVGIDREFVAASRVDNQLSCYAAVTALVLGDTASRFTPVIALFDHEEVGSVSAVGAGSALLTSALARVVAARPGSVPDDWHRARTGSLVVSVDNAHATHPNYPDRHEPAHRVSLNAGPVLKSNVNQRYATDALSAAAVRRAAAVVSVPVQDFVTRSDLACGSTIGPTVAAELGVSAVDLGAPQLAMHACRELCGAEDPAHLVRLVHALLVGLDEG